MVFFSYRTKYESPAGDHFWKFSRQCSIFGRIGDQWVAISSPGIFVNVVFLLWVLSQQKRSLLKFRLDYQPLSGKGAPTPPPNFSGRLNQTWESGGNRAYVKMYCQNHYFQLKRLGYCLFHLKVISTFFARVIPYYAKAAHVSHHSLGRDFTSLIFGRPFRHSTSVKDRVNSITL